MNNCKNCKEPVTGNYCPNCGQAAQLQRIDRKHITREIANSFSVERGMLYTIRKMLFRPGESIKQYISEDRSRYVKPVSFLIITSLIYTLIAYFFNIDAKDFRLQLSSEAANLELPTLDLLLNWINDNSGYSNIILGFFMAFCVKLMFRKSGYNLFEIFVLFCYTSGISSLFFSVMFVIQGLAHVSLIHISSLLMMIYYAWATGQFFGKKKVKNYIKAFVSYLLGVSILSILMVIVVAIFDMILK